MGRDAGRKLAHRSRSGALEIVLWWRYYLVRSVARLLLTTACALLALPYSVKEEALCPGFA